MGSSRFGPEPPETWILRLESRKSAMLAVSAQLGNSRGGGGLAAIAAIDVSMRIAMDE